ncbi:hypothetical protein F5Y18DRAFT_374389 [Xylariaceae sp. FL1019]|nr:hypothetical protein F5Y18DRAFT_374389 [Xylariaceae sp. FL1019]
MSLFPFISKLFNNSIPISIKIFALVQPVASSTSLLYGTQTLTNNTEAMTVTELAWIPTNTPGAVRPEYIEAGRKAIDVQSEWTKAHAPTLPAGPRAARGAALYQQVEDRSITLVTAHWASVAQHHEWIGSSENSAAMGNLGPMIDPSRVEFFHLEGVEMFPVDTIEQRLLTVLRILVQDDKKEKVERTWTEVRGSLEMVAGSEHRSGWRIERQKDDDKMEEFVIIGAWKEQAALTEFQNGKWNGREEWDKKWSEMGVVVDVKCYERLV